MNKYRHEPQQYVNTLTVHNGSGGAHTSPHVTAGARPAGAPGVLLLVRHSGRGRAVPRVGQVKEKKKRKRTKKKRKRTKNKKKNRKKRKYEEEVEKKKTKKEEESIEEEEEDEEADEEDSHVVMNKTTFGDEQNHIWR